MGDHRLVRPQEGEDALARILELPLKELGPTVVWLDDVQGYANPAMRTSIQRLLQRGLVVIATIRQAQLDRFTTRGDVRNPVGEALTDPALVERANCERTWSTGDRARLGDRVSNEHLLVAVAKGIPVGVYCVAGREMVLTFQNSRRDNDHPFRYWLVRTVLDWYRTGINQPVPAKEAERVMTVIGETDGELEGGDFPDALKYATDPIIGEHRRRTRQSMLTYDDEAETLAVHDYLLDYDQQKNAEPVPDEVWILRFTTPRAPVGSRSPSLQRGEDGSTWRCVLLPRSQASAIQRGHSS